MAEKKYVFSFKEAHAAKLGKDILGGKGFGLAEMTAAGVNIPQGFTISTEACNLYYASGKKIPDVVWNDIVEHIHEIERESGKKFGGGGAMPLLVSVRSGARQSMPGMMDTILNLGTNDVTVKELAEAAGNERFAWDSYRRFLLMFTNIAKGHPRTDMDKMLDDLKAENGYKLDTEVTVEQLKGLVAKYKAYYKSVFNEDFPQDPYVQLKEAVAAVFRSWDNERANIYRQMNGIPYEWGTAVNVQTMVFGNMGEDSGTGVAFSRSPSTGEKGIYAEFLPNAQAKTSSLASARRSTSTSSLAACPTSTVNSPKPSRAWNTTSMICRTWSTPSKKANSTSSRPAMASAPPALLSRSPATSSTKA